MSTQHALAVSKPVSGWNKPLKINYRTLFISLGKAVVQGAAGAAMANPALLIGAIKDTIGAYSSFEKVSLSAFSDDPGQIAWVLIHRSLLRAIGDLIAENIDLFKKPKKLDPEKLADKLDLSLEETEVLIDESFFRHPKALPIVEAFQKPFSEWLRGFGLRKAQAIAISERLPTHFVFALNQEWGARPDDYVSLKLALDTPFTKASERERAWLRYRAWLQKQVDERMFYEAFSLRQVYVPLRAYYEEKEATTGIAEREDALPERGTQERKKVVVPLAETLEAWVRQAERTDAIRVISGGPGSGKSSFAKMLAAKLAETSDIPALYVPLHHFDISDDLEEAVGAFVRGGDFLPHNPLDSEDGEQRLFIIFDGLDELAMQGRVGAEAAQRFVREVQKKVGLSNSQKTRLQVLISGRELVVQANASEFRKPGQVLHVLPYYLPENEREEFEDAQQILEEDQRQFWWKQYGKASGKRHTSMPKALSTANLDEITAQPLLNYLVALSLDRGKLDFSTETNLNAVYQDLLEAVYERGWEEHAHAAIQQLEKEEFGRILEEIALAAWHGEGRTTTVRAIEEHCKSSGLIRLLDAFQESAQSGVTRLLTAFYFRSSGINQRGDETFEFTHKSFGEYLTARRIVRAVSRIHKMLERRKEDLDEGWGEQRCLVEWAIICGPSEMDGYLFSFVLDEVRLQDSHAVAGWQQTLSHLIGVMLRHGMPMERLNPRLSYQEEASQARNAEEALLAVLNACARLTEAVSHIDWPSRTSLGTWIKKLQSQRSGPENTLTLACLSFINARSQALYFQDFYGAVLRRVDFQKVFLSSVMLQEANLQEAFLQEAFLGRADLQGANLQGANLQEAYLQEADLRGANLQEANLRGAYLEEADLRGADLQGANLRGADLRGAVLQGAIIDDETRMDPETRKLFESANAAQE